MSAAPLTAELIAREVEAAFPGTGNRCTGVGPDWATAEFVTEPANLRPGGFVSGPTQFALADAVLWYLVFGALGRVELMALTSELSIRYLRPAQGRVLRSRATLDAAGRRNVVGTVVMWMDDRDDRPVSVAQGTYVLPRPTGD